jgi:general secretion pathway protein C
MSFARRYRLAVELALLALVAYLAALGVSAGVQARLDALPPAAAATTAPVAVAPATLADWDVIVERDVFNAGGASAAPARTEGLRLWGVGLEGRDAWAVIGDARSGRQELYRVGDAVGGARLAAIEWDRVTLARAGGESVLELTPPAAHDPDAGDDAPAEPAAVRPVAASADEGIRRTSENAFIVDRREIAGAVDNMSGLLTQLRAVGEVRDGRPAGFRLFQIKGGSLFARLGLQDGDVVQRVNGTAVAEPAALLAFLSRLGKEPRVALDIVRGDTPRTLVYDLR